MRTEVGRAQACEVCAPPRERGPQGLVAGLAYRLLARSRSCARLRRDVASRSDRRKQHRKGQCREPSPRFPVSSSAVRPSRRDAPSAHPRQESTTGRRRSQLAAEFARLSRSRRWGRRLLAAEGSPPGVAVADQAEEGEELAIAGGEADDALDPTVATDATTDTSSQPAGGPDGGGNGSPLTGVQAGPASGGTPQGRRDRPPSARGRLHGALPDHPQGRDRKRLRGLSGRRIRSAAVPRLDAVGVPEGRYPSVGGTRRACSPPPAHRARRSRSSKLDCRSERGTSERRRSTS